MACPICSVAAYRAELYTCPICGAECDKDKLDALAMRFFEWCRDREEDERVFGTKVTVQ
jgi:hypothetical protein